MSIIPESNTNQKKNNVMEPTSSPNHLGIQKNINGLSDPPSAGQDNLSTKIVQPTEDNELQPITINAVFDNLLENSDDDTLKAFNLYRKKKLLSQSMMDIALFSANANQLRYVLDKFDNKCISYISVVLLSISIILQILVGTTAFLSIQYNVKNIEERKKAFTYGNYVIVGIFLITVVNILISAFGKPA